jgi:magnesium transporter
MVVNCIAYKEGRRIGEISIDGISEALKQDGAFIWLGLREPDMDMLGKIQEEFGLHELAVEDACSAHQRPKLGEYGDSLFLVLQTAQLVNDTVEFGETHVFVGPRFLVSIRHGSPFSYQKVRERCENLPRFLAKGPGFALYALMDFIVDGYGPVVDGLQARFERLEGDVFNHQFSRRTQEQLYTLKRELLMVRGAVEPLLDICSQLMRFHTDLFPKNMRFYFRDISDHVKRIDQAVDRMQDMLTSAMQVHLTLVTVRQNDVVKRLAGWGAILAFPTMVFSLYGMNFKYMPELEWEYGYPAMLGLVAVGCVLLYRRLKQAGWL